jgi:hypothetical protein
VQLDPTGTVVLVVQIVAFLMLLVGVYPSKQREENINLVKHGILSTIAVAVNLITIFALMLPIFLKLVTNTAGIGLVQFPIMWLHAAIGLVTLGCSFIMIGFWAIQPLSELNCAKRWRLMKPTLEIWAVSIALGAFIKSLS